jgi:hypothetical protein
MDAQEARYDGHGERQNGRMEWPVCVHFLMEKNWFFDADPARPSYGRGVGEETLVYHLARMLWPQP